MRTRVVLSPIASFMPGGMILPESVQRCPNVASHIELNTILPLSGQHGVSRWQDKSGITGRIERDTQSGKAASITSSGHHFCCGNIDQCASFGVVQSMVVVKVYPQELGDYI